VKPAAGELRQLVVGESLDLKGRYTDHAQQIQFTLRKGAAGNQEPVPWIAPPSLDDVYYLLTPFRLEYFVKAVEEDEPGETRHGRLGE
jgi:hypothetical protein